MPLLVKEAADVELPAGQPASSSAGAPAISDARAYTMSQDTKGIRFSINEETFSYTIQSLVKTPSRPGIAGTRCMGMSLHRPIRTSSCATCRR
eukprot:1678149-Pyramimonas_sp.AAC.1